MKKTIRRLRIKKRAQQLGARITEEFNERNYLSDPRWDNACRTLIRLNRIVNKLPPFTKPFKDGGWVGETYESNYALKAYGNYTGASY